MRSLWFVMPAHGRVDLARICMRQLRRTCDQLAERGVRASAVVIACDENLDTARELGFGWVRRPNWALSQKYNDGIQLACDPDYNPRPVDYVVPCGSDDWVHPDLFTDLPDPDTMVGFQQMAFVREDGRELTVRNLPYEGGSGIRIYPRQIMATAAYRPADEDRKRACDTSILVNLKRLGAIGQVEHRTIDPLHLVDWKSPTEQLNSYDAIGVRYRKVEAVDPFDALAGRFPDVALEEMRAHYDRALVAV